MNARRLVAIVALAVALAACGDAEQDLALLPSGAEGGAGGAASMAKDSAEGADARMIAPWYGGETSYVVRGDLPALDGKATAYVLADGTPDVARLARALGLEGTKVTRDQDGWLATDGTLDLRVQAEPGNPWWLGPHFEETVCAEPDRPVSSDDGDGGDPSEESKVYEECVSSGSAGGGGVSSGSTGSAEPGTVEPSEPTEPSPPASEAPPPAPEDGAEEKRRAPDEACPMPECPEGQSCIQVCPPPEEPERPADLPTKDEAGDIARRVLKAAGLDVASAKITVDDGFTQWYVSAEPELDGMPTVGWTWSVGVGRKGAIESASGWIGKPEAAGDYPLVGTTKGVERLRERPGPIALMDARPEIAMCRPGPADECLPPEPVTRTITGARLVLAFTYPSHFVPSYQYTLDDGGYEIVPAVEDRYLAEPDDGDGGEPTVRKGGVSKGGAEPAVNEGAGEPATETPAPRKP